jgi:hypothetical protein
MVSIVILAIKMPAGFGDGTSGCCGCSAGLLRRNAQSKAYSRAFDDLTDFKDAGIDGAPQRRRQIWRAFPGGQAKAILSVGFLHVDTAFLRCLYMLFFIQYGTRHVSLVGSTARPSSELVAPARPQVC